VLSCVQAFKRKGETYKIVWPGKAEFVRMAAKFGATIVPFAAIGCDEAVTHHLSADEVEQLQKLLPPLPFKLPWQQSEEDAERLRRIPAARVGVNATMEDLEAFGKVGTDYKSGRYIFFPYAQLDSSAGMHTSLCTLWGCWSSTWTCFQSSKMLTAGLEIDLT
jgi:hypothetical protein